MKTLTVDSIETLDINRAGVSFKKSFFCDDEFYIGGTRISKETADRIVRQSRVLWINKYKDTGDLAGYTKEWKAVLMNDYGVAWDGIMGKYTFKAF